MEKAGLDCISYNNRLVSVAPHKPAGSYEHGFVHTCRLYYHQKMGMAAHMAAGSHPISGRGSQKKLGCIRT